MRRNLYLADGTAPIDKQNYFISIPYNKAEIKVSFHVRLTPSMTLSQ